MSKRNRNANTSGDDLGSFILGLLFGGLAGAAAALWYAPQSGKETRDEATHAVENVVSEAEHVVDNVRYRFEGESMDDALEAGKAEARRFREYTP